MTDDLLGTLTSGAILQAWTVGSILHVPGATAASMWGNACRLNLTRSASSGARSWRQLLFSMLLACLPTAAYLLPQVWEAGLDKGMEPRGSGSCQLGVGTILCSTWTAASCL